MKKIHVFVLKIVAVRIYKFKYSIFGDEVESAVYLSEVLQNSIQKISRLSHRGLKLAIGKIWQGHFFSSKLVRRTRHHQKLNT